MLDLTLNKNNLYESPCPYKIAVLVVCIDGLLIFSAVSDVGLVFEGVK